MLTWESYASVTLAGGKSLTPGVTSRREGDSGLLDRTAVGLSSLFTNLDIVNKTTIPNLPGLEQILVTYPQVVTGGFPVVRRDSDGVVRAHFGLVLGGDDPSSCYTGYAGTYTRTPGELGAVPLNEAARCAVLDGVDPNPGDGINETGSSIRGAQEVGRTGDVANPGGVAGTGEDLLEEILDAPAFARGSA